MGDKLGAVYSSLFENVYGVDLSDYIWEYPRQYKTRTFMRLLAFGCF